MRILVTGGAGFIGSHLVEKLVGLGHEVIVLDDLSTGREENIAHLRDSITFVKGSITDRALLSRVMEGVQVVFHQAALGSVPRSVEDPVTTHEVNITGTFNVLLTARDAGVQRVVYAASSSAYGDTPTLPKVETMLPNPLSPYAVSKLVGEYYCQVFTRVYGLETVSLRYFNVFGPRQNPHSQYAAVIPKFITAALKGEPLTVFGDGEQSRDFTYIDNVVQANLLAMESPHAVGKVYNVACGGRYTLNELIRQLEAIFGRQLEVQHLPPRAGDVKHSEASIAEAQRDLGYRVLVSFEEGLKRTVGWYKEQI
ncbi:MAG: capsular polysaccharide biosynthesis protein [Armatimonadota bacterium]|nr:MAG: capsular polysaccharide biosynthesis protein [Armatimonadota bacterium]